PAEQRRELSSKGPKEEKPLILAMGCSSSTMETVAEPQVRTWQTAKTVEASSPRGTVARNASESTASTASNGSEMSLRNLFEGVGGPVFYQTSLSYNSYSNFK
ncbi:unnamed protein product, partial [Durusdinium trenchii]